MLKISVLDKISNPEILWSRPLNTQQKKGSIFVLGGEKDFPNVLSFLNIFYYFNLQSVCLGFPDKLIKFYQDILPEDFRLPLTSTASKTLEFNNIEKISATLNQYDLMILGVGLSENAQTKALIDRLILSKIPTIFAEDKIVDNLEKFNARKSSSLFFLSLQKAASLSGESPQNLQNSPLSLQKITQKLPENSFLAVYFKPEQKLIMADQTDLFIINQISISQPMLLAFLAAFWSINIKKPKESFLTAAMVAKIFGQNYHHPKDIQSAITKAESLI